MIKYRPVRWCLSASIKDEETFSTMEEMLHFIHDRERRFAVFVGSEPPAISDFTVSSPAADCPMTGYRNERVVLFRNINCVGYCGE